MTDLIKRLEEAEAGSGAFNQELALLLGGYVLEKRGKDRKEWFYPVDREWFYRDAIHELPRYTTSLDAALALAERVLPGWCWMIERHKNGTATAGLHEWNAYREADRFTANTPALALCAAILKATDTGRE
jgi:hypothetical protein